jgi:hypothetical protein
MVSAISSVPQIQPEAPAAAPAQKPAQSEPSPASIDSVQLSKTAQAALALLQETRETSTQTAQEAGKGDLQAQRLLAKQAAEKLLTT